MVCQENIPVGHMDLVPAKPNMISLFKNLNIKLPGGYTLCCPLPPVFSSSGHHSDGVACATLEVSESGLSFCWVTEMQWELPTSLRTIGHSGGVEAVRSWA